MISRVVPPHRAWIRASFSASVPNMAIEGVSELIGIEPDDGGLLRPEVARLQFDTNDVVCVWVLRSRVSSSLTADEHLADLLERLKRSRVGLQRLSTAGALLEFVICVLGDDLAVPLGLSCNTVRAVSDMSASIRVFFTGERKFLAYSASCVFGGSRVEDTLQNPVN